MLPRLNVSQKVKYTSVTNLAAKSAWLPAQGATGYLVSAPFTAIPYDGHTLKEALAQVERLVPWQPKVVTVDLGYRSHNYQGTTKVQIVNYRTLKSKTRSVSKWLKRRAAIEPVFGHLKSDNRMSRNHLKGTEGDKINALLCACGFNFRKLLRAFLFWLQKTFGRPESIKLKPHLAFGWVV